MSDPLDNVLVVSIEQAVAAPFVTSRLADGGARVIKIEREAGDFARDYDTAAKGESAYFVWLNRGKQSLVLDFKDPDDAALLENIIGQADVFVQNLAPGALERAGFGSEQLHKRYPELIICDISGYGDEGPYKDMKAYDLLIQAETGLADVTGSPEAPGRVGVSVADIATGMYAHSAIVEALYDRTSTGTGKWIKLSLFDALADWMTVPFIHAEYGGKAPKRIGLNHPSLAPYGAYAAKDGLVLISIQNEREWVRLCDEVLGKPELARDEKFDSNVKRVENRPALDEQINSVLSQLMRADLIERLQDARIAYGALNSVEDFAAHPQLRRVAIELSHGSSIDIPAPPARIDGKIFKPGPVPSLGQHGKALRAEFSVKPKENTDEE